MICLRDKLLVKPFGYAQGIARPNGDFSCANRAGLKSG